MIARDVLFGHQYYWEQHIGPFLAKIPIFILLLLLVASSICLLVLFCYCCFWNLKYWPVHSVILLLCCYCTFLYFLLKGSNQWVILGKTHILPGNPSFWGWFLVWSKCNESVWPIYVSIMNCIFFSKVNMMIWNTYWVLLGIRKPKFVLYCFYISLRWNIFVTVWYWQFEIWYCYVLFGQNIEAKYCVGTVWQPKKVIPRISGVMIKSPIFWIITTTMSRPPPLRLPDISW